MRLFGTLLVFLLSTSALAGVSVWIPFDNADGHIAIPVTLNGVETRAILDSGASGNGISERFLEKHEGEYTSSKQIYVQGIYGKRKVRLVDDVKIEMFGTPFKIDQLMPVRIYNSDFLVGLPFFENFILQIDYPNSRLRIMSHDVIDLKKFANVKMKKSGGQLQPLVRVNLNDEYRPWLTLDTGNSTGILIPRVDALRFGWTEEYRSADVKVAGVTKVATIESFNIPKMMIGPFTLENVIVMVPAAGEKTTVGQEARATLGSRLKKANSDGILGYDVLKHFIVTIDYKQSLLHLEPPAE